MVNFKIFDVTDETGRDVQTGQKIIAIHILPIIPSSKINRQ